MSCDLCWTTILSALSTPLLATVAGYIAWRQWQTARNKLRFDLFDKRLAVYTQTHDYLVTFLQSEIAKPPALDFETRTYQGKFLFGENVGKSLKYIGETLGGLAAARREYPRIVDEEKRKATAAIISSGEDWLRKVIIEELDQIFGPYLRLTD
ncbi:MAG TPA: hypothetical protein VGR65_03865 [Casimicrobiaceae bacterium]|jgi:argonaute-like protein implicated in RNA metabolism and viral defense|nr:hypothetical protein [Casimicrobiaceae bacterium]